MALSGFIDSGGGSDWAGDVVHINGTDGRHYASKCLNSIITLGSLAVWCFETSAAAFTITSAQFTTDLAGFGVTDPDDFEISTVIPCKGTAYIWALGQNADYTAGKTEFPVVGIRYRVDSPSVYVADGYMHRLASVIATGPSDIAGCYGATVIDGDVYAVIAAGAFYAVGDDINVRIVYGLPMSGNDVDLTTSSWDDICGALDCFAESGVLGGLSAGADLSLFAAQKVALVKANGGIGVMFRRSNTVMPFTVVASNLTNTGEVDRAADFGGLPISGDEGLDYNGSADSNLVSYYRSPNVEYSGSVQELLLARCFKDGSFPTNGPGVNYMRIRRYTFSSVDNSITFLDTQDILFNVAGMIQDDRYAFTCREGSDINVCGATSRYLQAGYASLALPATAASGRRWLNVSGPIYR